MCYNCKECYYCSSRSWDRSRACRTISCPTAARRPIDVAPAPPACACSAHLATCAARAPRRAVMVPAGGLEGMLKSTSMGHVKAAKTPPAAPPLAAMRRLDSRGSPNAGPRQSRTDSCSLKNQLHMHFGKCFFVRCLENSFRTCKPNKSPVFIICTAICGQIPLNSPKSPSC